MENVELDICCGEDAEDEGDQGCPATAYFSRSRVQFISQDECSPIIRTKETAEKLIAGLQEWVGQL